MIFDHCTFQNCTFRRLYMNHVLFNSSMLFNTEFASVKTSRTTFINSKLYEMKSVLISFARPTRAQFNSEIKTFLADSSTPKFHHEISLIAYWTTRVSYAWMVHATWILITTYLLRQRGNRIWADSFHAFWQFCRLVKRFSDLVGLLCQNAVFPLRCSYVWFWDLLAKMKLLFGLEAVHKDLF